MAVQTTFEQNNLGNRDMRGLSSVMLLPSYSVTDIYESITLRYDIVSLRIVVVKEEFPHSEAPVPVSSLEYISNGSFKVGPVLEEDRGPSYKAGDRVGYWLVRRFDKENKLQDITVHFTKNSKKVVEKTLPCIESSAQVHAELKLFENTTSQTYELTQKLRNVKTLKYFETTMMDDYEEITLYSCIPKNGGCLLLGKSKWWYGYCSDGSLKRADCSAVKRWGPPYNPDDTVGCRVEIEYVEESKHNIKIYFSKDHAEFNGPVIISDQSEKAQAYCILEFKGPKTLATYSALRIVAGEDGILAHGGSGNYYHGFDENDAPVTVGVYDQGWQDIFIKQKHEMIQRKPNPYLAQVYGVATLPYGVALIMEPMRGGSVFDLLHGCHGNTYRVPIIPTFLLLRMCAEIATGMASLLIHTAGQIEQISTRNMFLSESLNCKLCPTFYDHVGNIRPSTAQQLLVLKLGKIIYELILRQVPGETLSAASELVSAVNAYIDTLRDERSVNIHKYLRDVMISCLASHEQRPSIKQVRDSLALKLSTEQNVSEMQHAVADISESMGLKWIPFTAECVALGQISSARR